MTTRWEKRAECFSPRRREKCGRNMPGGNDRVGQQRHKRQSFRFGSNITENSTLFQWLKFWQLLSLLFQWPILSIQQRLFSVCKFTKNAWQTTTNSKYIIRVVHKEDCLLVQFFAFSLLQDSLSLSAVEQTILKCAVKRVCRALLNEYFTQKLYTNFFT